MYVQKRQFIAFRGIATLLSLALLLMSFGIHMFTKVAHADNVTLFSDTISDSHPDSASDHTIAFTLPNGMITSATFELTFDAAFDATSIVLADVDIASSGVDQTLAATNGAGQWGVTGFGTNTWTFTSPNDVPVGSSTPITIYVGESGPNAVGGENQVTNPTATSSYPITVGGGASTIQDSGTTRVAIIENVLVTAQVPTTLDFLVNGVDISQTFNGTSTTGSTTSITIPFGVLTNGSIETLAQDLYVTTNASNGYVVTVYQDDDLRSSTGAIIDGIDEGSYTDTPAAWPSPSGDVGDNTTWGHWGMASEDATTTRSAPDEFDYLGNEWAAASNTPRVLMSHASSSDGSTQGIGWARVGYQIEITALQEAGDDYETTLTYIATPTF